jgi:hypothetical protein
MCQKTCIFISVLVCWVTAIKLKHCYTAQKRMTHFQCCISLNLQLCCWDCISSRNLSFKIQAVRQQTCKQRMKHSQKEGCVMLVFILYTLIFMLNFKLTTWLVAKDCQALQKVSPRKRWIRKHQLCERLRLCAACDWSLPLNDRLSAATAPLIISLSVKVKVTLEQATKAQTGIRGTALLFLKPRR